MKQIKVVCPNCNGKGEIPHYHYNCQGICFRCNGTGYIMEKQYTEAELEKINNKLIKKQQVNEKELRGFKNTNTLYIIAENNTYYIKTELKQDGAIWNYYLHEWTFENDNLKDKYNLVAISYEDATKGNLNINKVEHKQLIKENININDNTNTVEDALNSFIDELGF